MAQGALDAGARLVVLSCGGELARLAAEHDAARAPPVPDRHPDAARRARCDGGPGVRDAVPHGHAARGARRPRARRSSSWRAGATSAVPEVDGDRNPARELARRIGRTIPLVYGARRPRRGRRDALEAVDQREREGAGVLEPVPRARPQRDLRVGPARRRHPPDLHAHRAAPRPRAPAARTTASAATRALDRRGRACRSSRCEAEGEGRLAQLLDLIYLGDWTSCYLALDNDVDPGPDRRHRAAQGPPRPRPRVSIERSVGPLGGCHPVIRADSIVTSHPGRRARRAVCETRPSTARRPTGVSQ